VTTAPAHTAPSQVLPEWLSVIQITLTAMIMIYSVTFGAISIVFFYALWLPLYVLRPDLVLRRGEGTLLVLLLPLLCFYSALWSDYPSLSFYLATQFFTTVLALLALARTASITAIAKGFALGTTAIMLLTIATGVYHTSGITGEAALVGNLGSKNQVGVNATIAIFCALMLLGTRSSLPGRIMFSGVPLLVGLIALYLSKSATSVFTLAAALSSVAGMYGISRVDQRARFPFLLLAAGGIAALLALAAAFNLSLSDAALSSAGKDTTLTGRTILWNDGLAIASERPMLGHGYFGFWVQGNPRAEELWKYFEIPTRTGFHFHSMYVQAMVDLGIVGTMLLALLVLVTLGTALRRAFRHGAAIQYSLPLGLAIMFGIRSFFEMDFWGNYHMGTVIMFSMVPLMAAIDRRAGTTSKT